MTRRMVHDELFANIDLGECPIEARLLYIGMIVHADDHGRMRADLRYLRAKVFPFDNLADDMCLTWRNQLATKGLILLYDVDQKTYLQHPKWDRWQTLRKDRVKSSDCPSPSVDSATKWQPHGNHMSDRRLTNGGLTEVNRSEVNRSEPNRREGKLSEPKERERERKQEKVAGDTPAPPSLALSPSTSIPQEKALQKQLEAQNYEEAVRKKVKRRLGGKT